MIILDIDINLSNINFGMITWSETIEKKTVLYHVNTYRFIAYIKAEDVYTDIAKDVEARFGTLSYELNTPLTRGKTKMQKVNQ